MLRAGAEGRAGSGPLGSAVVITKVTVTTTARREMLLGTELFVCYFVFVTIAV